MTGVTWRPPYADTIPVWLESYAVTHPYGYDLVGAAVFNDDGTEATITFLDGAIAAAAFDGLRSGVLSTSWGKPQEEMPPTKPERLERIVAGRPAAAVVRVLSSDEPPDALVLWFPPPAQVVTR